MPDREQHDCFMPVRDTCERVVGRVAVPHDTARRNALTGRDGDVHSIKGEI